MSTWFREEETNRGMVFSVSRLRELVSRRWPFLFEGLEEHEFREIQGGSSRSSMVIREKFVLKQYRTSVEDLLPGGSRVQRALMSAVVLQEKGVLPKNYGSLVVRTPRGGLIQFVLSSLERGVSVQASNGDAGIGAESLAEALLQVHSVRVPVSGYWVFHGMETPLKYFQRAIALKEKARVLEQPVFSSLKDRLRRVEKALGKVLKEKCLSSGMVLRHGDVHPGNVLLVGEKVLLLDWDYASLGGAELEFVIMRTYGMWPERFVKRIMDAYQKERALNKRALELYELAVRYSNITWSMMQFFAVPEGEKEVQEKFVSRSRLLEFIHKNLEILEGLVL